MVRASVAHLAKVLRLALGIAKVRDPHIRTMCGRVWASDLQQQPAEVLCRKLHFLLLHCRIETVYYMFSVALFHNPDVLSIAVQTIRQRNDQGHPLARRILHRHRKYIYRHNFFLLEKCLL